MAKVEKVGLFVFFFLLKKNQSLFEYTLEHKAQKSKFNNW